MDFADHPAELHYQVNGFQIVRHGNYVLCAITGKKIPLANLKYWSAELQEAYISAEAVAERQRK